MIWFLVALTIFTLGSMLEFRTKSYSPLRPMPSTDRIWKILGGISGVWIAVLFVWCFFVFKWWVVPLLFVAAATIQGFFYERVIRMPAAPLLSMLFMSLGGIGTALILSNIQAAAH